MGSISDGYKTFTWNKSFATGGVDSKQITCNPPRDFEKCGFLSSSKGSYTFPRALRCVREGRCSIVGGHSIICQGRVCLYSYNHLPLKKKAPSTLSCGVSPRRRKRKKMKRKKKKRKTSEQTKQNQEQPGRPRTNQANPRTGQPKSPSLTPPCRPSPRFVHVSIRLREQLPQPPVDRKSVV